MATTKKTELFKALKAARAKRTGHFVQAYRSPHQIARLAYNSSIVEGRELSRSRLRDRARELLETET